MLQIKKTLGKNPSVRCACNLSAHRQMLKKEGKSVWCGLVGVRGYGRGRTGRKQAKCPKSLRFWAFKYQLNFGRITTNIS